MCFISNYHKMFCVMYVTPRILSQITERAALQIVLFNKKCHIVLVTVL